MRPEGASGNATGRPSDHQPHALISANPSTTNHAHPCSRRTHASDDMPIQCKPKTGRQLSSRTEPADRAAEQCQVMHRPSTTLSH